MITINKNFKLNSNCYTREELLKFSLKNIENNNIDLIDLSNFILEVFNQESFILCKTSGSTGEPKVIKLEKASLLNSVNLTKDYFNLKPGYSAISFLPMNFIAGKMMLLRAMVIGLNLQLNRATSNPSDFIDQNYYFSAMTPMQAFNSVNKLRFINKLLVGGGHVSNTLRSNILSQIDTYYESYGMTETLTHIAINKVTKNRKNTNVFKTLKGVSVSLNKNNCLIIDAPLLSKNKIFTNDLVKIFSNNEFYLVGRIDNVINSGGVKLNPENIERKISKFIPYNFFISSIKDNKLGEKVVLIIESKEFKLKQDVFINLNKLEKPKQIYFINKFIYTDSNKIDRFNTKFNSKKSVKRK